ncbi:hypothetical protein D3C80_1387490 [compost metagenome]
MLRRHQAATRIAIGDPPLSKLFLDSPLLQRVAVQNGQGQLRLGVRVLQAGEQPGLAQGDPAGLQRLQGDGGQSRQGGQPADLDLAVAERPGDGLHAKARLQHQTDCGDDVGDMDGNGGIGQDDGRRLTFAVSLDENLDGMIIVYNAAVTQQPERHQPAAAVQHHVGGFVFSPRPDGWKLQEAGGGDGVRQLRNVVVGRLPVAKVLGGDVEIAEAHDGLTARRYGGRRSSGS